MAKGITRKALIESVKAGDLSFLKPCPFCGGTPKFTERCIYSACMRDHGRACLALRCWNCHTEMTVYEDVKDYYSKATLVANKWNSRIG